MDHARTAHPQVPYSRVLQCRTRHRGGAVRRRLRCKTIVCLPRGAKESTTEEEQVMGPKPLGGKL